MYNTNFKTTCRIEIYMYMYMYTTIELQHTIKLGLVSYNFVLYRANKSCTHYVHVHVN